MNPLANHPPGGFNKEKLQGLVQVDIYNSQDQQKNSLFFFILYIIISPTPILARTISSIARSQRGE